CFTNNMPSIPTNKFLAQSPPTCIVTDGDDPCVACAKTNCCAGYTSCFDDTNCACMVACLAGGGTVAACTSAGTCGSLSTVSISTSACLDSLCPTSARTRAA